MLTPYAARNYDDYHKMHQYTIDSNLPAIINIVTNFPYVRSHYLSTLEALQLPTTPPDTPFFVDIETDAGATPLMLACAQAEVTNVEALLHAGAFKDSENRRGHTALSWTCVCGHHQVVAALLAGGVDATLKSNLENKTALHHAAYNGTNQCLQALLDCYFQMALDRRFNLSKEALSKTEQVSLTSEAPHEGRGQACRVWVCGGEQRSSTALPAVRTNSTAPCSLVCIYRALCLHRSHICVAVGQREELAEVVRRARSAQGHLRQERVRLGRREQLHRYDRAPPRCSSPH